MLNKIELPIAKYLVIGSFPLGIRYSKDIDVICYKKDIQVPYKEIDQHVVTFEFNGKNIECLLADNQESLQYFLAAYSETTYDLLYIIKAGHIFTPHKEWSKHILDYHILRKLVDTTDINIINGIKLHKKTTEERLKLRLPKLKGVSKEEFFDDAVVKYYEHDFIHECMAHKEYPMYSYMQKDKNSVECFKDLWDKFSYIEKIQCVLEECYVIALERRIIPMRIRGEKNSHYIDCFKWALMRVCTTLCSGWFRQFAIDNYFTIFNSMSHTYVEKFFEQEHKYEEYKIKNGILETQ